MRPANLNNYLVSEHSLTRGKLQVTASCKAVARRRFPAAEGYFGAPQLFSDSAEAFKGKAVVRECEDDLMPYKWLGVWL